MCEKDLTEIVQSRIDAEDTQISESDVQLTESGDSVVYHSPSDSDKVRVFALVGKELDSEILEALRTLTGDPDQFITTVGFKNKPDQLVLEVQETSAIPEARNPTRELAEHLISEA